MWLHTGQQTFTRNLDLVQHGQINRQADIAEEYKLGEMGTLKETRSGAQSLLKLGHLNHLLDGEHPQLSWEALFITVKMPIRQNMGTTWRRQRFAEEHMAKNGQAGKRPETRAGKRRNFINSRRHF